MSQEVVFWFLHSWFFFSSRRRHTRLTCDWSLDVCSSDLEVSRLATASPSIGGHGDFVRWRRGRRSGVKSNSFLRRRGRRDQLFDRGKDGSEFFVIFLFQTLDLAREIGVAVHQTAKLYECSHDRDVDFDRARAA